MFLAIVLLIAGVAFATYCTMKAFDAYDAVREGCPEHRLGNIAELATWEAGIAVGIASVALALTRVTWGGDQGRLVRDCGHLALNVVQVVFLVLIVLAVLGYGLQLWADRRRARTPHL